MSSALEAARGGRGWGLSGLFHALDDVLDDEGRPLGERRASSRAKQGVEIELKACPYSDHRSGQPMNVSALRQVMAHWDATVADIAAFQSSLDPTHVGWLRLQCAVVDQLSRPAVYLLRTETDRVPASLAVGYKLAAGYFSVVNALGPHVEPAAGQTREDWLARHLLERRALVGASEVCAGPAPLIARATAALLDARGGPPAAAPDRPARALLLVAQLRLGQAWRAYDEAEERDWLAQRGAWGLSPATAFLERELAERERTLGRGSAPLPEAYLGEPGLAPLLAEAVAALRGSTALDLQPLLLEAMSHQADAGLRSPPDTRAELAGRIARYLVSRRAFRASVVALEQALRAASGWPTAPPVVTSELVHPRGGCPRWFEAALGHRLELDEAQAEVRLANHRRVLVRPLTSVDAGSFSHSTAR